jgi:RNA polymerase sigma factor (sigma-70 family)
MERWRKLALLDENGNRVDAHIEDTLGQLVPTLRREYPTIPDDVGEALLTDTACKIARHEREHGPIEKPFGFAWTILKNAAISALRGRSIELHRRRAETRDGSDLVSRLRAWDNFAERIEDDIFLEQAMKHLTMPERLVYLRKLAGHTSEEIAQERGSSVGSVDVMFTRIKQKIRRLAGVSE